MFVGLERDEVDLSMKPAYRAPRSLLYSIIIVPRKYIENAAPIKT